MAQSLPRFCPRCGTPTVAGEKFCPNCGLVMTEPATMANTLPANQPYIERFPPAQPSATSWAPAAPISPSATQARRKRGPGRAGCLLILLVLLLLIGAGSYFGAGALGFHVPGFGNFSNTTQAPVTTVALRSTVIYAGVTITLVSAQQAQNFIDDPNTTSTGMLRLNLQEQNSGTTKVSWLYADIARLILPGNTSLTPTYVKAHVGIAPGATQSSIVDFAVPTSNRIDQLVLRLGAQNEAQMDIPLKAQANLTQYSPKTVQPNAQLQYLGLNWTLVSATKQWSIIGQQASKGMLYVILTFKVDNTLSQQAIIGSAYDFMRLKTGNTTVLPVNTNLPVAFDAGVTGKTGAVSFLVPRASTAFTVLLLAQNGADQATADFQIA